MTGSIHATPVLVGLALMVAIPWLLVLGVRGLRSPVLFLIGYAAILPFGSSMSLPLPVPPPFHTVSTFVGLTAVGGLLVYLFMAGGSSTRVLSRAVPLWLLFLGVVTASALWSWDTGQSQVAVFVLASLVGLYFLAALVSWKHSDLRWLEHALTLSGAITGIYALVLHLTGRMHMTGAGWPRFQTAGGGGEGGDPNVTAAALILPFVVAIHGGLRSGERAGIRVAYLSAAALTGAALVLTGSRGGLLGLIGAIIVLAVSDGRRIARLLITLVPIGIVSAAIVLSPGFIQSRLQVDHSSGRVEIWQLGLRACPEVCLLGSGYATFNRVFYEQALRQPEMGLRWLDIHSHSLWVRIIIEGGVIATLLLLGALLVTVGEVSRLPDGLRGAPLAALAGLLVTQTFLANVDFKYFWMVLIYVLMAVQIAGTPGSGRTLSETTAVQGPDRTMVGPR